MLIGIGDKAIEIHGLQCRVLQRVKFGWLNPGLSQCDSCGSVYGYEPLVHMCIGDGDGKFTVVNIPAEKWPMGCDVVVDDKDVKIYAPEILT